MEVKKQIKQLMKTLNTGGDGGSTPLSETLDSAQDSSAVNTNTAVEWHVDPDTKQRYSINQATGESQWEHEVNEEKVLVYPATNRRYSIDSSGKSKWVDDEE